MSELDCKTFQDMDVVGMKPTTSLLKEDVKGIASKPLKDEVNRYSGSREAIGNKYAAIREHSRQASKMKPVDNIASTKVSLLEAESSQSGDTTVVSSSGLATKWASMKSGFQSLKAKVEAKKFIPLRQLQDNALLSRVSSSQTLDEIFQRLKRPSMERGNDSDEDEDGTEIGRTGA